MNDDKIIAVWKPLVEEHGLQVLSRPWLNANKKRYLINTASALGYKTNDIANLLGEDLDAFKKNKREKDNKEKYLAQWKDLINQKGVSVLMHMQSHKNNLKSLGKLTIQSGMSRYDIAKALNKLPELMQEEETDFCSKNDNEKTIILKKQWSDIYDDNGIKAMSIYWAQQNDFKKLAYWTMRLKLKLETIAEELNIKTEFQENRGCNKKNMIDSSMRLLRDTVVCLNQIFWTKTDILLLHIIYENLEGPIQHCANVLVCQI